MNVEFKPFIDVSTLADEALDPYNRDMPDVAMALPWSSDIFPDAKYANGNPDQPNGAVWPWRLFLGSEDDPNKTKVSKWELVDDLAGLTNLWAGVYNGTIFLHAADDAPENGPEEDDDVHGAPIGENGSVWRNGQPIMPFMPVPKDMRLQMLQNADGKWRRLVWEPIGIFDVATSKTIFSETGRNIKRHTLWCIVENQWVVFMTTAAMIDSPIFADGAPVRWKFGYYKNLIRESLDLPDVYTEGENDGGYEGGGFVPDGDHLYNGYRLAPLPWQEENGGELEDTNETQYYDGVNEGQFYALPPNYPCGRYLATCTDYRIYGALVDAYQGHGEHYEYEYITQEDAKNYIIEPIRKAATHSYSIDPALLEEKGHDMPSGVEEGMLWQTDPPPYEVVFSYHLDAQTDRWPHWLAVMACHAPTALLTASSCMWYNDWRPAEGWPPGSGNPDNPLPEEDPNDPDDRPPNGDEDWYIPDFPYDPDNPDDDDDDDGTPGTVRLEGGYFYEGGNGVQVKNTWQPRESQNGGLNMMPGWDFVVSLDDVTASGSVIYNISLTVRTEKDSKTYDYPQKGVTGLSMYYSVTASGATFTVTWKSSYLYQEPDAKEKEATATVGTPSAFSARMSFNDVLITSDTPPDFCGTYLVATKRGYFTKRGRQKVWDNYRQKWTTRRYSRQFTRYRLSLRGDMDEYLARYVAANAPERDGTASPDEIQGRSDDLDGPKLTVISCGGNATRETVKNRIGNFSASIVAEYSSCNVSFGVTGQSSWNEGTKHGSISGTFIAELPEITKYFNL